MIGDSIQLPDVSQIVKMGLRAIKLPAMHAVAQMCPADCFSYLQAA